MISQLMTQAAYAKTASFSTDDSSDRSVTSMTLTSRIYVPFDKTNFGFGMGAAEQIAYDPVEKKVYAVSEVKSTRPKNINRFVCAKFCSYDLSQTFIL